MNTYVKYRLAQLGNLTFRLIIPAIAAAIIWGIFKEPKDTTWLDKVAGGSFVVILLVFAEIRDYIRKSLEQMKLDHQVAFMKNRGVLFIFMGIILVMIQMFADKAIVFFFVAGGSNLIAYAFELLVAKYYRKLYPRQAGVIGG